MSILKEKEVGEEERRRERESAASGRERRGRCRRRRRPSKAWSVGRRSGVRWRAQQRRQQRLQRQREAADSRVWQRLPGVFPAVSGVVGGRVGWRSAPLGEGFLLVAAATPVVAGDGRSGGERKWWQPACLGFSGQLRRRMDDRRMYPDSPQLKLRDGTSFVAIGLRLRIDGRDRPQISPDDRVSDRKIGSGDRHQCVVVSPMVCSDRRSDSGGWRRVDRAIERLDDLSVRLAPTEAPELS